MAYFRVGRRRVDALDRGTDPRRFPDIRLDLRLIELMTADRESAPDIEICVDDDTPVTRAGYHSVPLLTDEYVAVVPSIRGSVRVRRWCCGTLVSLPWIDNDVARGICRANLLKACTAAGFAPDFAVEAHDFRTAIRFVAAGGTDRRTRAGGARSPDGVHVVRICDPTPSGRSCSARETVSAAFPLPIE